MPDGLEAEKARPDDPGDSPQLEDGSPAAAAVARILEEESREVRRPGPTGIVSGGARPVAPFSIEEIQKVSAEKVEPAAPVTVKDVRDCWTLVLDAAREGKPWALKFILEKHPLAKKYARMSKDLADMDGEAIARIAYEAGVVPELEEDQS